jgi:hypothetical protein
MPLFPSDPDKESFISDQLQTVIPEDGTIDNGDY